MIKFKLQAGAQLPKRGSEYAAGYDIHSIEGVTIPAGGRTLVQTGVQLAHCPQGIYLRVAPRSKLANLFGIDVLAGVVDCDYRGCIGVILYNTSDCDYTVKVGDAIAQLVPEVIANYEVCETDTIEESERGAEGIHSKELRR